MTTPPSSTRRVVVSVPFADDTVLSFTLVHYDHDEVEEMEEIELDTREDRYQDLAPEDEEAE